jgi:hypothetical protein
MSSDDKDQGHSINDDYCMVGLCGDNESGLEADQEELLGSHADPIEVVDITSDGAASAVAGDGVAIVAGDPTVVAIDTGKRKQNTTSEA